MAKSRKLVKKSVGEGPKEPVNSPMAGEDLRTEAERRRFSYTLYIPERRSAKDRRKDGQ